MTDLENHLFFLGVQLKALGQSAGLWLMVLFSVQIHAFSIWDILLLCVPKKTVGKQQQQQKNGWGRFFSSEVSILLQLQELTSAFNLRQKCDW